MWTRYSQNQEPKDRGTVVAGWILGIAFVVIVGYRIWQLVS